MNQVRTEDEPMAELEEAEYRQYVVGRRGAMKAGISADHLAGVLGICRQ